MQVSVGVVHTKSVKNLLIRQFNSVYGTTAVHNILKCLTVKSKHICLYVQFLSLESIIIIFG